MIFVTVGAQMPFDRLVKTVDDWASSRGRDDVFAQIGPTDFRPTSIQWTKFLDPTDFRHRFESARAIVAHAGTGSIITALQLGKPIVVMPRRVRLRETRNDHQVATAEHFRRYPSVVVARNDEELISRLERIDELAGLQAIGSHASPDLIGTIRNFINGIA